MLFLVQLSVFPDDSVMAVANCQAVLSRDFFFLAVFVGNVKYFLSEYGMRNKVI